MEDAEGVVPEKVEDGVKQQEEEEVQRAEVVVVNAVSEALTPIQKETEIQEATGEESSSDTDLKVELQTVTEETTLVSKVHLDNRFVQSMFNLQLHVNKSDVGSLSCYWTQSQRLGLGSDLYRCCLVR